MSSSALKYLDEIVEPTIAEFRANPTSVRHSFLACVVVFHTIDRLAEEKGVSRGNLRKNLRENTDFDLVDDVAHAFKHVSAMRKGGQTRLTVSDVISRPPGVWGEAVWDLSRFDDPVGGITLEEGRDIDLLNVLEGAVRCLRSQL